MEGVQIGDGIGGKDKKADDGRQNMEMESGIGGWGLGRVKGGGGSTHVRGGGCCLRGSDHRDGGDGFAGRKGKRGRE